MMEITTLQTEALALLKNLIATQSFSSQEEGTALHLENWLKDHKIDYKREKNNLWAVNQDFDEQKTHPTFKQSSRYRAAQ